MTTVKELFDFVVNEKDVYLTPEQENKLLIACERAIKENEDDYSRQIAGKIYLNLILDFPELTL
ncbi:MAG: hypothetical protein M9916_01920 [Crocinitomicaceae bacterium]|jgi:hypothetical protein|nr:hypothetical protein [Crocinitomicaceae bacterium]